MRTVCLTCEALYVLQVEQHNSREAGAWFVRDGKVYDATPFLDQHPGGASIILSLAGQDATDDFDSIHDDKWE